MKSPVQWPVCKCNLSAINSSTEDVSEDLSTEVFKSSTEGHFTHQHDLRVHTRPAFINCANLCVENLQDIEAPVRMDSQKAQKMWTSCCHSSTDLASMFSVRGLVAVVFSDAVFVALCRRSEKGKKGIDDGELTRGSASTVREPASADQNFKPRQNFIRLSDRGSGAADWSSILPVHGKRSWTLK